MFRQFRLKWQKIAPARVHMVLHSFLEVVSQDFTLTHLVPSYFACDRDSKLVEKNNWALKTYSPETSRINVLENNDFWLLVVD